MSHFTVGVVIPRKVYSINQQFVCNPSDVKLAEEITRQYVEDVMAPYNENADPEYWEHEDKTEDAITKYLDSCVDMVKMPNGEIVDTQVGYSTKLRPPTDEERDPNSISGVKKDLPNVFLVRQDSRDEVLLEVPIDGGEKVTMPCCTVGSFNDYLVHWYEEVNITVNDDEEFVGRALLRLFDEGDMDLINTVWNNGESRDEIRERLTDKFTFTVSGVKNPRWDYWSIIDTDRIPTKDGKFVNACCIRDLARELPWSEEEDRKRRTFYEIAAGQREATPEERKEYAFAMIFKPEYYRQFYPTYDNYRHDCQLFYTYAILHEDYGWVEPGQVGWFGTSDETPESRKEYLTKFWDILDNSHPDDVFVMVDCHI